MESQSLRGAESAAALGNELIALLYQNAGKEEFSRLLARIDVSDHSVASKELLSQGAQMAQAIRERFDEYLQRERGLNAVIETAQDLTAIRDLDRTLQAIVHRARKLMGADIGYLSIRDREEGDFYVRATDGAFSENFKKIRVPQDVGICGYVARNKSPYSSAEYGKDPRFSHTGPIDMAVTEEGIKSILGVPLLAGADVIGVLFVGDRYVRAYNAWEMSILSTLAAHASVAIENARLFEQTQVALKQASDANALLKKQSADTQIAAEAHEQLTTLVARGGGLQDICDMVASMLDGHVSVIDEAEQCIHASAAGNPEPGHEEKRRGTEREQELLYTRQDKIHAALVESRIIGRSVAAYVMPDEVCRVSAVVGSRGLLGGLIIRTATELNDVAVRIFERSSMVTGVVLLAQERNEYAARQEIPAIFRGLLSQPQHDLARLTEQAARHGLNLSQSLCVAVLQAKGERAAYVLGKLRGLPQLPATLFDEIDGAIVLISGLTDDEELRKSLERVIVQGMREPVTGVISRTLAHPRALPECYQAMLRCIATMHALGRSGAIFLERELALYAFLFDKRAPEDIEAFLAATLGKLYQEGRQRKSELARTLLSYLDHGHNARAAAADLGIHINTFRQRLDAIDSLMGTWNDGSRALEIHVALRLLRLREEFTSTGNSIQ
ncbi:helix-turn-helix domain-containing protein [Noviherbaspirillum sp. ST9]|uniref:helix-turn-helix domain-containing protein n=1 Tax=Noviherbaspirillum sp. ST9 TaxID=3401606 RepID=UPI003B588BDC